MRLSAVLLLAALSLSAQVPYGQNPAAGSTFTHDGVKLYYEVYGSGDPLLMIHGNGGSIADMRPQIEYFRTRYRVIAMDSRDHGKSADSPAKITYEKMAGDQAALLDHLQAGPAMVLGWSDGGIEALLLGIHYPAKVTKIVSMAANLTPPGVRPDVVAWLKGLLAKLPAGPSRDRKVMQMMLDEPKIQFRALESITAPTLIMASDHDVIRDEHTLEIYHHIRNGELCIFPNSTHAVSFDDSALFNTTVERFLRTPFVPRDRIKDLEKSLDVLRAPAK